MKRKYLRLAAAFAVLAAGAAGGAALAQGGLGPITPAAPAGKPIPEGDIAALIKSADLTESPQTIKQMLPGWTRPKMMLVQIDRPDRLAWLQEAVPGVKLVGLHGHGNVAENDAEALPYAAEADAMVNADTWTFCTDAVLKAAKKLKWMQFAAAGPDDCVPHLLAAGKDAPGTFVFTGSQRLRSASQSENAIALMTALMRDIDIFVRMDVGEHITRPNFGERGQQIEGRTLLVVGLGGIGTEIARMGHGLGMHVIATRGTSHEGPDFVDYVGLSSELPDLIGKADAVLVAAPLTPDTRGLFNAAMFARMKHGAIFVNIARGQEVMTDDLVAALKSGQVGGAGLEVTDPEPLPDNHPLFSAPNVIVTIHGGAPARAPGDQVTDSEKIWQVARENMRRYAAGDKMLSVVDVKRGY